MLCVVQLQIITVTVTLLVLVSGIGVVVARGICRSIGILHGTLQASGLDSKCVILDFWPDTA
jgi:hypothetical protein